MLKKSPAYDLLAFAGDLVRELRDLEPDPRGLSTKADDRFDEWYKLRSALLTDPIEMARRREHEPGAMTMMCREATKDDEGPFYVVTFGTAP